MSQFYWSVTSQADKASIQNQQTITHPICRSPCNMTIYTNQLYNREGLLFEYNGGSKVKLVFFTYHKGLFISTLSVSFIVFMHPHPYSALIESEYTEENYVLWWRCLLQMSQHLLIACSVQIILRLPIFLDIINQLHFYCFITHS